MRRPRPVRATFAGLRVLPVGAGETANARRETVYIAGRGGMVSVAGGKLTTYRRIALDALELRGDSRNLDRASAAAARARRASRSMPLPAARPATRAHLLHLYGSLATDVLAPGAEIRRCSSRSSPAAPTCARRRSTRASTSGR